MSFYVIISSPDRPLQLALCGKEGAPRTFTTKKKAERAAERAATAYVTATPVHKNDLNKWNVKNV